MYDLCDTGGVPWSPGNYLAPHRGCSPPPQVFWTPPQDQTPQWGYTRPQWGCPLCKCSASVNNHAVDRQLTVSAVAYCQDTLAS